MWNICGVTNSITRLHSLVHLYDLQLLVLIEPKVSDKKLTKYRLQLGYSQAHSVCNGKVWIF